MTKVAAICLTVLFYANIAADWLVPAPVEMFDPVEGPR